MGVSDSFRMRCFFDIFEERVETDLKLYTTLKGPLSSGLFCLFSNMNKISKKQLTLEFTPTQNTRLLSMPLLI